MKKSNNSLKNTLMELFGLGKSDKEKLEEQVEELGIEHERKFIFNYEMSNFQILTKKLPHQKIKQFYLAKTDLVETRIRIIDDKMAVATTKIKTDDDSKRIEIESGIDMKYAMQLYDKFSNNIDEPIVEKTRYFVPGGKIFIDHFCLLEEKRSLIIVEVENPEPGMKLPPYCGTDVTSMTEFKNKNIMKYGLHTRYCNDFDEHIQLWVSQHRKTF